jgi:hypothetical protein
MKESQEQFECEYCGAKFNFRKDAEEHEQNCSARHDVGAAGANQEDQSR